jgi:hypothetical protein
MAWLLVSAVNVEAQGTGSQGSNAVYDSNGACCVGSSGFIDAKVFLGGVGQGSDLCDVIYKILNGTDFNYPATGAVIDARGITTNLACQVGSPWSEPAGYINKPSTILLPAGTITIPSTWIVPSGTLLIGEGTTTVSNSSGIEQTTIQAKNTFATGTPILQFGASSGTAACPGPACKGIGIEHLNLNGNNLAVNGIENANSQEQTYVDHVTLYQILGTGLYIHGNAQNSGPYSNITYDTNGAASNSATCVNLISVNGGTRGLRGLTCKANYSTVAVYLDSSNNLIRDVRIMGFDDGIRVGSQATAQSNVLMNILGDTDLGTHPLVINVIHISGGTNTISDLSIMGVANQGTNANTIADDRTSPGAALTDAHVAMYVLGKSTAAGYSRFTTSPHAATWAFGASATASGTCAVGSLYSSTVGGQLSVCDRTAHWVSVPLH